MESYFTSFLKALVDARWDIYEPSIRDWLQEY